MKTKEELNALKEEVEAVSERLHELTDDELAQVTGGLNDSVNGVSEIIQKLFEAINDVKDKAGIS